MLPDLDEYWAPYPKDILTHNDFLDRVAALEVIAAGRVLEDLGSNDFWTRQGMIHHVAATMHDVVTATGTPSEHYLVKRKSHERVGRVTSFVYRCPVQQGETIVGVPVYDFEFRASNVVIILSAASDPDYNTKFPRITQLVVTLPEVSDQFLWLFGLDRKVRVSSAPGSVLMPDQLRVTRELIQVGAGALAHEARKWDAATG